MLKDWIEFYTQKNLVITPVRKETKAPFLKDWNIERYDDQFLIDKYGDNGFALVTGASSDIIALDLDLLEKRYQEVALKILENYPTPVKRQGNRDKLPTYFYRYVYHDFSKINIDKDNGIEILSDGRCCVLPPSEHPYGYLFEWVGESLLEFNLDYLPEFNLNLYYELQNAFSSFKSPSEDFGRHLKLVSIASAMIENQERFDKIVNELLEYDKNQNNPPYFTDDSENHKHPPAAIASHIVASVLKTHCSKGKIYNPEYRDIQLRIDEIAEKLEDKFVRKKLPHLRGLGAVVFDYIYSNSDVKRAGFAFASTLAFISTVIGNKISWLDIHPNLYLMLIANSGGGKDWYLRSPSNIFQESGHKELKGEGQPASDTGIMMSLPYKRVRLDTVDEASVLFNSIKNSKNSYAVNMGDVYAQLYTSGGKYFDGKNTYTAKHKDNVMGNIGGCFSPFVSFIGAMTFNAFNESFDEKIMAKGLGGRFLYFNDERFKKSQFRITNREKSPNILHSFIETWMSLKNQPIIEPDENGMIDLEVAQKKFDIPIASHNDETIKELKQAHDEIEILKKKYKDHKMSPVVNRMYENTIRLSIIDAVAMEYMKSGGTKISIDKENVKWAKEVILVMFYNMTNFIENNLGSTDYENKLLKMKKWFDEKKKPVTKTDISRGFHRYGQYLRKQILHDLQESEYIFRVNKDNKLYDPQRDSKERSVYYSSTVLC